MSELQNNRRTCFEKFNLYIYVILPIVIATLYLLVKKLYNWNFISIPTFQEYSFELVLSLFGVLLTLLGIFTALPNTKFKLLMKRYNHTKIINRTLAIGIFSSLSFLVLYLFELRSLLQEVLFIFALTETFIAVRRIYTASKYSLLLEGENVKDS